MCYSKTSGTMQKYRCTVCDWVYDPAVGDLERNIPAGTPFDELPDDWTCPLCFVGVEDFEPYDEMAPT